MLNISINNRILNLNGLFKDRKLHFLKDSDSERVILKTTGEKNSMCARESMFASTLEHLLGELLA